MRKIIMYIIITGAEKTVKGRKQTKELGSKILHSSTRYEAVGEEGWVGLVN